MRLVSKLEIAQLETKGEAAFVQRMVKTEVVQNINNWLSAIVRAPGRDLAIDKRSLLQWEEDIEQQMRNVIREVQSIAEEIHNQAKSEAETLISHGNSLSQDLEDQAKKQIDKIIEETKIKNSKLIEQAQTQAIEKQKETQILCDKKIQETEQKIYNLLKNAEERKNKIQREADEIHLKFKQEAEQKSQQIIRESSIKAKADAEQTLQKAEQQKVEQIHQAEIKAREIIEKAKTEAHSLHQEAIKQKHEMIREAQREADVLKTEAEKERHQIVELGQLSAEKLKKEYQEQGARILSESHQEADELIAQSKREAQELLERAKTEAHQECKSITAKAIEEQERLTHLNKKLQQDIASHQATVEKVQSEASKQTSEHQTKIQNLKNEIKELTKNCEILKGDNHKKAKERDELQAKLEVLKSEFDSQIQDKKKKNESLIVEVNRQQELLSQKEHAIAQAEKEINEKTKETLKQSNALKELSQQKENINNQISKLKTDVNQLTLAKNNLSESIKSEKEKILLEAKQTAEQIVNVANEKAQELTEKAELEYKEQAQIVEQELAARRLQAQNETSQLISQQQQRYQQQRKEEIREVMHELTEGLPSVLAQIPSLESTDQEVILSQIKKIIRSILQGESIEHQNRLKTLLSYDPEHSRRIRRFWYKTISVGAVGLMLLIVALSFPEIFSELKSHVARQIASDQSAQQAYVDKFKDRVRQESEFHPVLTFEFKKSYSENIISTTHFRESVTNEDYNKKWTLALNQFFLNELDLHETTVVHFRGTEAKLIKQLVQMRDNINAKFEQEARDNMKREEMEKLETMRAMIGGDRNFERFWAFHQKFFEENRVLEQNSSNSGRHEGRQTSSDH